MFIETIRTGNSSGSVRKLNCLMPFSNFGNMTDEDLKSIFAFLQSLKPVKHYVDNSEPPRFAAGADKITDSETKTRSLTKSQSRLVIPLKIRDRGTATGPP